MSTEISIEWEENGCHMIVKTDYAVAPFNFVVDDPEQLYDRVKGAIGPWLRERDEAQSLYQRDQWRREFRCDPDESAGAYELSDPKHPDFHSVHADIWDAREGK